MRSAGRREPGSRSPLPPTTRRSAISPLYLSSPPLRLADIHTHTTSRPSEPSSSQLEHHGLRPQAVRGSVRHAVRKKKRGVRGEGEERGGGQKKGTILSRPFPPRARLSAAAPGSCLALCLCPIRALLGRARELGASRGALARPRISSRRGVSLPRLSLARVSAPLPRALSKGPARPSRGGVGRWAASAACRSRGPRDRAPVVGEEGGRGSWHRGERERGAAQSGCDAPLLPLHQHLSLPPPPSRNTAAFSPHRHPGLTLSPHHHHH